MRGHVSRRIQILMLLLV